jgi:hypothetical protein
MVENRFRLGDPLHQNQRPNLQDLKKTRIVAVITLIVKVNVRRESKF